MQQRTALFSRERTCLRESSYFARWLACDSPCNHLQGYPSHAIILPDVYEEDDVK